MFFLSLCFCVAAGCVALKAEKRPAAKEDVPTLHKQVTIPASGSYEECLELLPIHIMEYSFAAVKPLTFNIHYHTEEDIVYPVLKEDISEWSGMLNIAEQDYYDRDQEFFCLMWENFHSESVDITFECRIKKER